MQGAAGGGVAVESDRRNDNYDSIVSNLASLIEHVEARMKLIESAIASEAFPGNEDIAANVVVLDDVTPCYVKASAALNTCNAGLGAALHYLLDIGTSRHETGGSGESCRRPARSISRG
jgi:hypothetical protein